MKIYTDGSCLKNPNGQGGWAAVFIPENGEIFEKSGYNPSTTNNRMEMTAVLEGIKHADYNLPLDEQIEVYCDSAYVVNCFRDGWYKKWRRNNWIASSGKPVENQDLWDAIITIVEKRNIKFNKVAGHSDDKYNNICDELAGKAARQMT